MSKFFFGPRKMAMAVYLMMFCFSIFIVIPSSGQKKSAPKTNASSNKRVIYGLASFYADKFNGRPTASGEIFSQKKLTCACNMLPLGTWIKVTNVRNGKSVIVKVNDRMHPKMRRLVDLSKAAAKKIGYTGMGIERVKVEVIGRTKPN